MTRCQKKERYTIMGEEKKYTEEEIKTIVDDIICKAKKVRKKNSLWMNCSTPQAAGHSQQEK